MKSSISSMQQLNLAAKDVRLFFSSCLSMHIVPVLFAVMFIVVAQQNNDRELPVVNKPTVKKSLVSSTTLLSVIPMNATNANQFITLYKLGGVAYKLIR